MSNIEDLVKEDVDLLNYLKKNNLTLADLKELKKTIKSNKPDNQREYKLNFNSKRLKFIVLSDTHMGHSKYRPDILEEAVKYSKQNHSEFVILPGDILEGMSGREGHIYELDYKNGLGATKQINYGIEQLSQFEIPIYAITADKSHDGWFESKNNLGLIVGEEFARRLDNFYFLGKDEQDLVLDNGLKIRLRHPGGGTAYAISYKLQKYINAISGGDKPHILFEGHYHKALYMFYRNIHAFESGTLEAQTSFMKKMETPAHLGFWGIDVMFDKKKKSVDRIRSEFIPFY